MGVGKVGTLYYKPVGEGVTAESVKGSAKFRTSRGEWCQKGEDGGPVRFEGPNQMKGHNGGRSKK